MSEFAPVRSGFAYLYDDGEISLFFKQRELLDRDLHRKRQGRRVIALLRVREKSPLDHVPRDGLWHPCIVDSCGPQLLWQGVRAWSDAISTSWEWDVIERVGVQGNEERAANRFKTLAACEMRCNSLNQGWALDTPHHHRLAVERAVGVRPDIVVVDDLWEDVYGSHADEFPNA